MSITTIANRYARALADVLGNSGDTAVVASEIKSYAALIGGNQELHDVLASPVVALDRKQAILNALMERSPVHKTTSNFLRLLLSNQRLHQLPAVSESLGRELDNRGGVISAEVTTARTLSESEQGALLDQLARMSGKQVRISFKQDPEIIGGVIARIGSLIYDGSIRNQLALMKQQLAKG